jgi:hypothetical protein
VQHDRAFLVAAARRVHQRRAQGVQSLAAQGVVAAAFRLDHRPAQALHTGVDRTGHDRRLARLQLAHRRGPTAQRADHRRPRADVGRLAQARRRLHAQLAPQQVLADRDLPLRRHRVAGHGQAPHEQLVVALLERVAGHRKLRVPDRLLRPAVGQQRHRGLPQPRLHEGRHPVPRHQQPRLELETRRQVYALQQLPVGKHEEPLRRGFAGHREHVDDDARGGRGGHRVAGDLHRAGQGAAQLGQCPAQRPQRVVGVGEQQLGEVLAAGWALGQQQVAEQRPRLAATRQPDRPAVPLDGGRSEQPDRGHAISLPSAIIRAGPRPLPGIPTERPRCRRSPC